MGLHHGIKAGLQQSSYLSHLSRKYKHMPSCLILMMSPKTQKMSQFSTETKQNEVNFTCVVFIIAFSIEITLYRV